MKHSMRYTGASLIVAALVWSTFHVTTIRGAAPVAETWTVYSGEIIEIMPLHDIQDAKYGWVLIKDAGPNEPESFLEGGTARTFRYRPIQPGSYTLYGDIASPDGSRHIQRGFRFAVMPKMQDPPLPVVEGDGPKLVGTEPKIAADGTVTMRDEQQLLRLIPLDSQRRNIAIDTDVTVDADGDGNLSNDIENTNTFFQSTATPLYLWFASPQLSDRTIVLTAARADGQGGEEQRVRALSFDFARDNSLLTSSVTIAAQIGTGGTVRFRANLDASFPLDETPLLYRWAFGDGEESLETEPVHTYAAPGQFTVSLQIRNLSNGKEVGGSSTQLTIMPPPVASSAASSSAESVSSEAPVTNGGTSGGGSMRMILIGGAVLLASLIVGAGVVFLISRLRKGSSLDAHLAKMEQNIVNKEKAKLLDTTAPVAIKTTATVVPDAKPIAATQDKPAQAPAAAASTTVDANKAPAWLKKGLAGETTTATVTTPAATPVPPKPAAQTPAPAPAAQPPKAPQQTPAPVADAALPDWLKTPPAPAPAAAAAPATTPAPASSVDEKLPDWLKTPAPASTTPAPASVAPPVAAPAPVAPKAPEAPKPVSAPAPAPVAATPVKQPEAPKSAPAPTPVQPPKAEAPKAPAPATPAPAPKAPEAPKPVSPAPAPKPVVAPAPSAAAAAPVVPPAPKAEPKPAPTPAPVKAPEAPKPAAPVPPKVEPKPAPAVSPAPVAPPKPPVTPAAPAAPKPVETPKPAAPQSVPAPVAPKPVATPAPVVPSPAPTPAAQPKPVETAQTKPPAPAQPVPAKPVPQDIPLAEETIAVIRAESLNPPAPPAATPPEPPKPQA